MAAFQTWCKWAWDRRDLFALSPVLFIGLISICMWAALKWAIRTINRIIQ